MSKNADLRTCVEISMLNVFSVATDAEAYTLRDVFPSLSHRRNHSNF